MMLKKDPPMSETKQCKWCEGFFVPRNPLDEYCSDTCEGQHDEEMQAYERADAEHRRKAGD